MNERANAIFPLAIAAAFPPVGLILAAVAYTQDEPDLWWRMALASVLGAAIWALLLTA